VRKVVCHDCRKRYDFDKDDFCPRCGAFTQPPARTHSEEPPVISRSAPQKFDAEALKEKGKAAASLAETVWDSVMEAAGPAEKTLNNLLHSSAIRKTTAENAIKGLSRLITYVIDE